MKIIFFGASKFGKKVCEIILQKNIAEVSAIFTIPEEFSISYSNSKVKNVLYSDFSGLAEKFEIPLIVVEDKLSDYEPQISKFNADLLLVVGWYHKIPKKIVESAPLGCVGIHSSLLPKYRGGAPLVWAIINGEKETGVSLFYFTDEIDAGDIIGQRKFIIEPEDTIREVLKKAEGNGISLIEECLPKISDGTAGRIKQNHQEATIYPQRNPEDGKINWEWDQVRIKNFIRAQTKPYPGAFTIINGRKVIIWDANIEEL